MTTCQITGCEKPTKARGYCPGHYERVIHGKPVDVELGTSYKSIPLKDRFWARVRKTETCWLWTGPLYDGYGRIKTQGRHQKVHRLAYEWVHGPILDDAILDHKCRVRHCVRPDHLQVATRALNMQNLGVRVDNSTGVRGVTVDRPTGRYLVRATDPSDGRRVIGGLYEDLAEAQAAAIELRNRLMTNNLQDRMTA